MRFPRWRRPRLPASGWKRWVALVVVSIGSLFALLVLLVAGVFLAFQSPRFREWFNEQMITRAAAGPPEETHGTPGPIPTYQGPEGAGNDVRSASDLYRGTNVWRIHLAFTEAEWGAIQPQRIKSVPNWLGPDGAPKLRNPASVRNGLAGVLGFEFPWSTGRVDFGGVTFTNVAVRFKGNGTFLSALRTYRKSFKLDLAKHEKSQKLGGRSQFNLGNLSADFTCLSDTLAYEFFREAGVPAPRTAWSRVFLSIAGSETNRLLGLYVMVENPDAAWAREQFGVKDVALFKPVTYELFADLGTNWAAYEGIYDPKTSTTAAQRERVMDLARLVTHAPDDEFAKRIGEFVDLEACARFLAVEVLLANYDGILSNGQNFLLYLDPRSNRFGLIPWDLDHSWGEFPFIGTATQREQASIRNPWVGTNQFLARLMGVDDFRQRYEGELKRLLKTQFVPARMNQRIDEVAAAMRPLVAEWSTNRLAKFEIAISTNWRAGARDGNPMDPGRPVWQLKRFVAARAENVRAQLDGTAQGIVLQRQSPR